MRQKPDALTATQEQAITALLSHTKVRDAANHLGIAERTLWRWLAMPAFKAAYDEAKQALLKETMDTIQLEAAKSVGVIVQLRDDTECPYPTRLKAAHILASRMVDTKPGDASTPLQGAGLIDTALLPYLSDEELTRLSNIIDQAKERKAKKEQEKQASDEQRQ